MDCKTAESLVTRYINHTLSVDELEEFLNHIENCPSCYEELEIYFMANQAMRQLDGEEEEALYDLRKLMEQDIRKSRRYIVKKRTHRFLVMFGTGLLLFLGASLLFFFLYEFFSTI